MNPDDVVLDEVGEQAAPDEGADARRGTGETLVARGYDKRVVYGAAAAVIAVFIGFSFWGLGDAPPQSVPSTAAASIGESTPMVTDPPYASAARRAADAAADTSLRSSRVPPPSSSVIGGADGRPYESVGSGIPAGPASAAGAGGPEPGGNPPAGAGSESQDPRLAAWRAVRDAAPTSHWGAGEAAVGGFDPETTSQQPSPVEVPAGSADDSLAGEARDAPGEGVRGAVSGNPAGQSFLVPAFTRIDAALVQGINSEVPGDVVAQVTRDVSDLTGEHVAIPAGSRLIGKQSEQVAVGQRRIVVAWTALQLPDRTIVPLPGLPAADEAGAAGLPGRVQTHTGVAFGRALLLSAIGAGFQLSQPTSSPGSPPSVGSTMAAAAGQQLAELSTELLRRDVATRPTIRLQPGTYVSVLVAADLRVPERRWNRTAPRAPRR